MNVDTFNKVIELTCQFFDLDRSSVLSKTKKKETIRARRFVIAFLKEEGLKEVEIAPLIDKDRTTVYHHIKKHKTFVDLEREYERESLRDLLNF